MHIKQLFEDDRAVSPVIGVILMVAITVILAAVIGTFVLGLGDSLGDPAPSVQLSFEDSTDAESAEMTHNGGDTLDTTELTVLVAGSEVSSPTWSDSSGTAVTSIAPGETVVVGGLTDGTDVEIRIRHDPSSQIIGQGTVTIQAAP